MPREGPKIEKDILKLIPPPEEPPTLTVRRIGIHTSTAGGVEHAAERAYRLGSTRYKSSPPARGNGRRTNLPLHDAPR